MITVRYIWPGKVKINRICQICLIGLSLVSPVIQAQDAYTVALEQVKNQLCNDHETVEQFLERKLKPSHRDLGWQIFKTDDGAYDVERTFLISKSMEMRYRWRVNPDGRLSAVNQRSQTLCS
jgi:hypothetical protein